MTEVGIRELKQNASAVVARVVEGETLTITDRGRPVAVLSGIKNSRAQQLIERGELRPASSKLRLWEIPSPGPVAAGPSATEVLEDLREERL